MIVNEGGAMSEMIARIAIVIMSSTKVNPEIGNSRVLLDPIARREARLRVRR